MLSCKDVNEFLAEYVAGELPALRRLAFEAHLAVCGDCRRFLAGYRRAIAMGRDAMAAEDARTDSVPDDLVKAILAARKEG